jgi:cytochrome b6-f complex iron-sulfur subunit
MNRRGFLSWVGVGWLASSLPVAIAACSAQTTHSESATQKSGLQPVGTIAELDQTGELLNKKSPVGPVLVARTGLATNLVAVNPTCTHAGCTVKWLGSPQKFSCPCHGSEFGSDGKVLKGPATEPLKTYAAKIEGNSVLVNQS